MGRPLMTTGVHEAVPYDPVRAFQCGMHKRVLDGHSSEACASTGLLFEDALANARSEIR